MAAHGLLQTTPCVCVCVCVCECVCGVLPLTPALLAISSTFSTPPKYCPIACSRTCVTLCSLGEGPDPGKAPPALTRRRPMAAMAVVAILSVRPSVRPSLPHTRQQESAEAEDGLSPPASSPHHRRVTHTHTQTHPHQHRRSAHCTSTVAATHKTPRECGGGGRPSTAPSPQPQLVLSRRKGAGAVSSEP